MLKTPLRRRQHLQCATLISVSALIILIFAGCQWNSSKGPNIRKVKLDVQVTHFEKDFFALDTTRLAASCAQLQRKYGAFYDEFIYNIAAFSMETDVQWEQIKTFLKNYRPVYDSLRYWERTQKRQLKETENALKRAKFYFPEREIPTKLITYIGPIDGYGGYSSKAGLCIGLQQFMGADNPRYLQQRDYLERLYGSQKLRQFTPDYLPAAAISSWIERTFPDKAGKFTLKDKLVEEGRKLYLLKALLPDIADSVIFGYTAEQTNWCEQNASLIQEYFKRGDLLKTTRPEVIVTYVSDNLRPAGLPEQFPDNIGKYLGYLKVDDYMRKNTKTSLPSLMALDVWEIR